MQETVAEIEIESAGNLTPDLVGEEQSPIALSEPVLCCYVNTTNRIQVARLSHLPDGDWEHIFFPGQRFMFEAPPEVMLTIYKSPTISITAPEHIPCHRLQVPSN